jgi:hypothetical protein
MGIVAFLSPPSTSGLSGAHDSLTYTSVADNWKRFAALTDSQAYILMARNADPFERARNHQERIAHWPGRPLTSTRFSMA